MNVDASESQMFDLVKKLLATTKKEVEVKIPCVVTKVISRTKVNVKPLIKIVAQDGQSYSREEIEGLPVFTNGAGGKLISVPVKAGNIGWIEASDRDLTLFLQSFEESEPTTNRMHSFSDGLFVPDIMTNFTIAAADSDALVIQNSAGDVKITLDDSNVRIVNGAVDVTISNSSVTGIAPGGFNLNGFIIDAAGGAVSPATILAAAIAAPSILANGIEQAGHVHGGVSRGTASTDPVV